MRVLPHRKYQPMKAVAEFHERFNAFGSMDSAGAELRANLIYEEFLEVLEELGFYLSNDYGNIGLGWIFNGPIDQARLTKELADLLYVIYGTAVTFNLPLQEAFNEVHRSNMSKLGADGKPIYREDGKVMKGPNYSPADIEQVLDEHSRTKGL